MTLSQELAPERRGRAFTLVETMAVLAIFAIAAVLAAPLLSSLRGRTLGANSARIMEVLEQSREYAQTKATYVYVGFARDATAQQMQVGVLASSQGVGDFATPQGFNGDLKAVSRLLKFDNITLDDLSAQAFGQRNTAVIQLVSAPVPSMPPMFPGYPSFERVLRFNPRGEAELPVDSELGVTRWSAFPSMEIGLRTTVGDPAQPAAIQLTGLTGQRRLYRP